MRSPPPFPSIILSPLSCVGGWMETGWSRLVEKREPSKVPKVQPQDSTSSYSVLSLLSLFMFLITGKLRAVYLTSCMFWCYCNYLMYLSLSKQEFCSFVCLPGVHLILFKNTTNSSFYLCCKFPLPWSLLSRAYLIIIMYISTYAIFSFL